MLKPTPGLDSALSENPNSRLEIPMVEFEDPSPAVSSQNLPDTNEPSQPPATGFDAAHLTVQVRLVNENSVAKEHLITCSQSWMLTTIHDDEIRASCPSISKVDE